VGETGARPNRRGESNSSIQEAEEYKGKPCLCSLVKTQQYLKELGRTGKKKRTETWASEFTTL